MLIIEMEKVKKGTVEECKGKSEKVMKMSTADYLKILKMSIITKLKKV